MFLLSSSIQSYGKGFWFVSIPLPSFKSADEKFYEKQLINETRNYNKEYGNKMAIIPPSMQKEYGVDQYGKNTWVHDPTIVAMVKKQEKQDFSLTFDEVQWYLWTKENKKPSNKRVELCMGKNVYEINEWIKNNTIDDGKQLLPTPNSDFIEILKNRDELLKTGMPYDEAVSEALAMSNKTSDSLLYIFGFAFVIISWGIFIGLIYRFVGVIRFSCPRCGQKFEAEKEMSGNKINCESCKVTIKIP